MGGSTRHFRHGKEGQWLGGNIQVPRESDTNEAIVVRSFLDTNWYDDDEDDDGDYDDDDDNDDDYDDDDDGDVHNDDDDDVDVDNEYANVQFIYRLAHIAGTIDLVPKTALWTAYVTWYLKIWQKSTL